MAIIDLGKVSITWRGTYAGGTAYTPKDAVYYNGTSYICTANTTGNLPTDTSYWNKMAEGGDVATTLTTQGDVLYRDGSGLQRLGAGTNGQYLKTQGTGANPVWADVSVGAYSMKQLYTTSLTPETHTGSVNTAYNFGTPLQITPAASTDIFDIRLQTTIEGQQSSYYGMAIAVNTSDSWSSSTNHSTIKISTGEFGIGMGSGHDSDRYQTIYINQFATMTELGMSAGTLYYVSPIILGHSPAGQIKTGYQPTNATNQNRFQIMRLGV